jgi:UDPglucose 6-dehydrogenase
MNSEYTIEYKNMRITIVGTGYVGLVTGTCLSENGNDVTCVDIDKTKIEHMRRGHIPIYEPGLEELFHRNIKAGRLKFTANLTEAVDDSEIIFLALPTPPNEDGSADLSYILTVAKELGPLIKKYTIVINKSTVPVGTAEKVHEAIASKSSVDFDVVSNPEFLREGFAVEDFMKPERVVIGTESKKARDILSTLYSPFVRQGNPVYFMSARSSEMTKYAANAFLATKISFMNEIANLCELTGADVDSVRLGIGSDSRIGKRFLFPGIGYGGSCFPKDVRALQNTAAVHDYEFQLLESVTNVNDNQKQVLYKKIHKYFKNDMKTKTVALWGLAFKPDTDDIREAPSLYLIDKLIKSGASVAAYDPEASDNVAKLYKGNKNISFSETKEEALRNADALVIATEWSEFRTADFNKIKQLLKSPVIFDGRNLYELSEMHKNGFYYESIGREIIK